MNNRSEKTDGIHISTIITAYNRAETVARSIKSVLEQTYPVQEIIVIDDGSTDDTRDVVSRIDSPKIRYSYQENRGVSAALNRGIKAADGNWIAILDSDDCWRRHKIEKQVHLMRQNSLIDFVHTNRTLCWKNGKTESRSPIPAADFTNKEFLFSHWATKQSTVLFRKSLIGKTDGLLREDLRTCQDYEYFWKLILVARQIGYVAEPVVDITLSDDGLSRTDTKINRLYDNITAMDSVIRWIGRCREGDGRFKRILARRIMAEFKTVLAIRLGKQTRSDILKDVILLGKQTSGITKAEVVKVGIGKLGKMSRIR